MIRGPFAAGSPAAAAAIGASSCVAILAFIGEPSNVKYQLRNATQRSFTEPGHWPSIHSSPRVLHKVTLLQMNIVAHALTWLASWWLSKR